MSKIFIGTDHGLKGALIALSESGKILHVLPMPTYKDDNGDNQIDCFQVYSWLYENFGDYEHEVVACGERLHAIFKASASSTFNFGKNIGKITGIIECLEMEYYEVRAVDWQKHQFATHSIPELTIIKKGSKKPKRDTKAMAKICASKIWDMDIFDWINHDGVLDALLIADYARQTYKGN